MAKLSYDANLCKACQNVFDRSSTLLSRDQIEPWGVYYDPKNQYYLHNEHSNPLQYVSEFSRLGCRMCEMLLPFLSRLENYECFFYYRFRNDDPLRGLVDILDILFVSGRISGGIEHEELVSFYALQENSEYLRPKQMQKCGGQSRETAVHNLLVIWPYLPSSVDDIHNDTESKASWECVSKWVETCLNTHVHCQERQASSWWPTRLLDVGDSPSSPLRLIETAETQPLGPYITLSHRWGSVDLIQLTHQNLEELKLGISMEKLPKTFHDAVSVTRRLKARYLWIDSLCIIQKSGADCGDWQHEASLMSQVYQNSFCNVSATGAEDCSNGLFFKRSPLCILPRRVKSCITQSSVSPLDEQAAYLIYWAMWEDYLDSSPLLSRGWVVQERILSPRVIHFGKEQIAWECRELDACEALPGGLPPFLNFAGRGFKAIHPASNGSDSEAHRDLWQQWIRKYSGCQLTYESDKEAAMSGMARVMGKVLDDELVCGLWRKCFPSELLWSPGNGRRPEKYRAPSWSWLSIEGRIFYDRQNRDERKHNWIAKVQDWKVNRVGDGPLAPICGGYVEISMPVRNGTWFWDSTRTPEVLLDNRSDRVNDGFYARPDIKARFPIEKICLALIRIHDPGTAAMEGLILKQCSSGNEFRRVGVFFSLSLRSMGLFIQPLVKDTNKLRQMEDLTVEDLTVEERFFGFTDDRSHQGEILSTILQGLKPEDLELRTLKIV